MNRRKLSVNVPRNATSQIFLCFTKLKYFPINRENSRQTCLVLVESTYYCIIIIYIPYADYNELEEYQMHDPCFEN